jgi:sporulation protein YlmC with PRC-barrel domain
MTARDSTLKRASHVKGAKVKSPQGETLGTVHDLVLTPDLNHVSYIVLSTGGILGLGTNLHAIPWSAVSAGLNDTYIVPISKQQLKQSHGFRAAYWPNSADIGWLIQGTEPTYRGQTKEESRLVQERRFTRIRGTNVKDAQGRNAGSIKDMVVAMDGGRIQYTIVSTGGLFGLGTRYAAVPQTGITLQPERNLARIDVDRTVLEANSFSPNRFPDLANPAYAQRLDLAYAPVTGSTALGYVPAAPAAPAQRPATRPVPTPPPASETARAVPPALGLAEPTEAELTGTFNPTSIKTMEGTVVDTGKFKVAGTGPDMLWLRVRTDDGQIVTVNLGPRGHVAAQDFYIVRGDRLHLTGSDVTTTVAGKHVLLPTEITYDNQVLRLRSATGTPLWEGQGARATTQPDATSTGRTSGELDEQEEMQ